MTYNRRVFVVFLLQIVLPNFRTSAIVVCPSLDTISNGNVIIVTGTNLELATYTCFGGYSIVSGDFFRMCNKIGSPLGIWTGTEPVCGVHGNWADWLSWEACSVTCAFGMRSRVRTCTNPAPVNANPCVGSDKETETCSLSECPVNGNWALWGTWSTCTKTCATGTQTRTRTCTNPAPALGGNSCSGARQATQTCNTQNCPIDGDWTLWSSWSAVGVTCSDTPVIRSRERSCTNPEPQYNGANCDGDTVEAETLDLVPCPVDGDWTLWSSWSAVGVTCSDTPVIRSRERSCTNPEPQYNGADCNGDTAEAETLDLVPCPVTVFVMLMNLLGSSLEGIGDVWG